MKHDQSGAIAAAIMLHTPNRDAEIALRFIQEYCMHSHRGIIPCHDHVVSFGNDGSDARVEKEIALVQEYLGNHYYYLAKDDSSWAIVVEDYDRVLDGSGLDDMLVEAWGNACGMGVNK